MCHEKEKIQKFGSKIVMVSGRVNLFVSLREIKDTEIFILQKFGSKIEFQQKTIKKGGKNVTLPRNAL